MTSTTVAPVNPPPSDPAPAWGQSLTHGALGPALLHLVRARTGLGPPQAAQAWLRAATRAPLSTHPDCTLFCGAPALAYVLHTGGIGAASLAMLDPHIDALARHRLTAAHARMDRGELTTPAEYDLINGLTGIGTYLLERCPHHPRTSEVLRYLVRLTLPVAHGGRELPGWWTLASPRTPGTDFTGGHANLGIAHGIAGPLALLARALHRGVEVVGQRDAILRICAWMDAWARTGGAGTTWPRWVTRTHLDHGRAEPNPMPLAWCYGVPGQARALQLAATATGDRDRADAAGRALEDCARDPRIADLSASLCHGRAGLLQTLRRAATDTPALAQFLPDLEHQVRAATAAGSGLMEGSTGAALVLPDRAQATRWDAFLLIT
ncbi:lanthionine synthetase C family protein [Streptomonospora nanhaiensis]|uniref:lanthionine synthetase C family protein n=1 Tax=Streptomonospora nanhaiensis TaxID=1323731 RepID=UPI001C38D7E3|nr:lanthionine synthetase C family protein [Streptomonospora nanhaiensis]MBV2366855.1 lanthionine synthetase C family protein [Streptomonospora nanhaiensis]MBX9387645.1 lanthionine synthetase C family protein [Streptomonospora nanhaiensis]